MSERLCIYAYTEPGADYPQYFNITREEDGRLVLMVRGPKHLADDTNPFDMPGHGATIEIPLPEFRKMIEALRDEELVQMVGALIHSRDITDERRS